MPKEFEETLSKKEEKKLFPIILRMTGEAQIRLGITSEETIWKRANYDLNQENWRMLSDAAFNQRENTYDFGVYDRLRVNLDTDNQEGFGFHSNITVDPWSFTGKSNKVTLTAGGDSAEIELKYWSNTGYTIQESVYTSQKGDSFSLPEMKVSGYETNSTTITSNWGNSFTVPTLKVYREFQPVRELWFDYQQEETKFRFFPFAYQSQALTTNDPLRLSNNHIWWEDSPWIRSWKPGIYNSGITPADFTKGYWDNSLSSFTRDSDGTYLTNLRGFSFELTPGEGTSLASTIATPKGLWQDYSEVDNIISATRLKHLFADNFSIGATYTMRMGFNVDEGTKTDARNHVVGIDLDYELAEGIKASLETAYSQSDYDLSSPGYESDSQGYAYYFSIIGTYPAKKIIDLEHGYDGIKLQAEEDFFAKTRFFLAHMDNGFDPSLSSYRETRDDTFWSRHIHFRQPLGYSYATLFNPTSKWEDIRPYRIGNGIDIGRDVIGFRAEASWRDSLDNLFDVRNVHQTNGKYVETVARDEITYKINNRLTAKVLGIYHDLPKTKAGIDPFIFDTQTGLYAKDWSSDPIDDGKDPSLKTGSLGLEYAFSDYVILHGIWERTNDYTLAYDNFPRGILNSAQLSDLYTEDGKTYRRDQLYLYDQHLFPQPPYPFYDIFKVGLNLNPTEYLGIYLDYTRNEFKSAGQISDNMNHMGIEVSYLPTVKLGLYLKYVYSHWNDLDRLRNGDAKCYIGNHNVMAGLNYRISEDEELIMQYGEIGRTLVSSSSDDPFGGGLSTLDTQHIVRLFYQRRF